MRNSHRQYVIIPRTAARPALVPVREIPRPPRTEPTDLATLRASEARYYAAMCDMHRAGRTGLATVYGDLWLGALAQEQRLLRDAPQCSECEDRDCAGHGYPCREDVTDEPLRAVTGCFNAVVISCWVSLLLFALVLLVLTLESAP